MCQPYSDHAAQRQRECQPAAGQVQLQLDLDRLEDARRQLFLDDAQQPRFLAFQAEAEEGLAIAWPQALALEYRDAGGAGLLEDIDGAVSSSSGTMIRQQRTSFHFLLFTCPRTQPPRGKHAIGHDDDHRQQRSEGNQAEAVDQRIAAGGSLGEADAKRGDQWNGHR